MGEFAEIEKTLKAKTTNPVVSKISQDHEDNIAVNSAKTAVGLWGRLQRDGAKFWLDHYAKAHSAVKAGLGNIIKSVTGDDEFQPLESIATGWQKPKEYDATSVLAPIVDRLEAAMPPINAPSQLNTLNRFTVPGILKSATDTGSPLVNDILTNSRLKPFLEGAMPTIPEQVTPSTYLKAPSKAAEVAVDVITDPLLFAMGGPFKAAKGLARISGLTDVLASTIKRGVKILPKSLVDKALRFFTVEGGRDPRAVAFLNDFWDAEQKARIQSAEIHKVLSEGLTTHQKIMMGKRFKKEITEPLTPDLEQRVQYARKLWDDLSAEAVKEGFLMKETFVKTVGKYMPRMYTTKVIKELETRYGVKFIGHSEKLPTIGGQRFKARKDIPLEKRMEMGEIEAPAFPAALGFQQVRHDLNVNNLFKRMAKKEEFVSNEAKEGFTKLTGDRWGILKNRYVNKDLMMDLKTVQFLPSQFMKKYLKALALWKVSRILPNPASHARNYISNIIMADLSPGTGLAEIPGWLHKAGMEMSKGGKYLSELKKAGAWNLDWLTQDRAMYDDLFNTIKNSDTAGLLDAPQSFMMKAVGKGKQAINTIGQKLSSLYTGEDNIFKLMHYMVAREKMGMETTDAIKYMRKWGLDYSKVSPAVRLMQMYTTPFVTYQAKALPRVIESAIKTPDKMLKWPVIFDAWERMSMRVHGLDDSNLSDLKKNRGGINILTPWSDADGKPIFMDLTYFLPWGDLAESSGLGGLPSSMTFSNPFAMILLQLAINKNIYFDDELFKDKSPEGKTRFSIDNVKSGFDFIYKSLMPSVAPGGYSWDKMDKATNPIEQKRQTPGGMKYSLKRTLLDVLFGLKLRGVDIDRAKAAKDREWQRWIQDREKRINAIGKNQTLNEDEKNKKIEKEKEVIMQYIENRFGVSQ